MAEETVFFNPGDAIAKDFDFQSARKSAEIFKVNHEVDQGLIVAKDDDGKFAVFYEAAGAKELTPEEATKQPTSKYTVLARL